jgi:hypothetical protein
MLIVVPLPTGSKSFVRTGDVPGLSRFFTSPRRPPIISKLAVANGPLRGPNGSVAGFGLDHSLRHRAWTLGMSHNAALDAKP